MGMSHGPRRRPPRGLSSGYVVGCGEVYRPGVSLPPAQADKLVTAARNMDCTISGLLTRIIERLEVDENGLPSWYEPPAEQEQMIA